MNRRIVLPIAVTLLASASYAFAEEIGPGKSGQELIELVRDEFRPGSTLSYKNARIQLFSEIDNRDGKVTCVYTGQKVTTDGIPSAAVMNTEHTWPQSKFKQRMPMKSDLHHLFATLSKVNGVRGNNPFAEIPDDRTERWWRTNTGTRSAPPPAERDEFSESTRSAFEPREDHKGNVARAMFYFWTVYGEDDITANWITPQLPALLEWHREDEVDDRERQRNARIKSLQGNDNPFVLDPTLAQRVFGTAAVGSIGDAQPGVESPFVPVPTRVPDRPELPDAARVRFATWNARELFSVDGVEARREDLKQFAQEVEPDILFLQEVTSIDVVQAVRDAMGLHGYDVACSDFSQDDTREHASLEVAIISRFPLDQVIEFDPSPDNEEDDEPDEAPLPTPLLRMGIPAEDTHRGYLWARIDQIRVTVAVVHLKSSRGRIGPADARNAREREFVAAAVAAGVNEDMDLLPGYTNVLAGDFNVGNADQGKLGHDLTEDCLKKDCNGADRYDETHAILAEGLIGGLRMRNVALAITEPTFVSGFQGTGPIDNIYVDGTARDRFSEGTKASSPHGSDHFAVWTDLTIAPEDTAPPPASADAAPDQADRLRVCSFNIQFLGSFKKRDDAALSGILSDYDLVVVQELVAPPAAGTYPDGEEYQADAEAREFFDEMEALGFEHRLSEEDTGSGDDIHSAGTGTEWWVVFFKPERVKIADDLPSGFLADDRSNHDDYERVPYAFPFRSVNDETDFVLISVHLMPGSSEAERRAHELAAIAEWIDAHDEDEKDFIILGDMNIEDEDELSEATPDGFLSLNDECVPTNTNVNGPKPYDHVMYRPEFSREVDLEFDFRVVDLIAEMKPLWPGPGSYPGGPPYNHNTFRQFYSDHHPVEFQLSLPAADDD